MRHALIVIALFFRSAISVMSDSELVPEPVVVSSAFGGPCYFEMLPKNTGSGTSPSLEAGLGTAYRLNADGSRTVLYRTHGWFSGRLFITRDGRGLVRIGPWPTGPVPTSNHLALAFYRDGTEVRRYSTVDLLRDQAKVRRTVTHYFWLATPSAPGGGEERSIWLDRHDRLHVVMADGGRHTFDVQSGERQASK